MGMQGVPGSRGLAPAHWTAVQRRTRGGPAQAPWPPRHCSDSTSLPPRNAPGRSAAARPRHAASRASGDRAAHGRRAQSMRELSVPVHRGEGQGEEQRQAPALQGQPIPPHCQGLCLPGRRHRQGCAGCGPARGGARASACAHVHPHACASGGAGAAPTCLCSWGKKLCHEPPPGPSCPRSPGDGSGGDSIYGKAFNDEKPGLKLKHDAAGVVAMANSGCVAWRGRARGLAPQASSPASHPTCCPCFQHPCPQEEQQHVTVLHHSGSRAAVRRQARRLWPGRGGSRRAAGNR